jgi:hypothetical protein
MISGLMEISVFSLVVTPAGNSVDGEKAKLKVCCQYSHAASTNGQQNN